MRPTEREVFPFPLVVLVKVTVSVGEPVSRLFALLLTETVTDTLAPADKLPVPDERVTQLLVFDTLQLIALLPVFWRV